MNGPREKDQDDERPLKGKKKKRELHLKVQLLKGEEKRRSVRY